MPKNTERGTLWNFSTTILSQNSKNIEGGPLGIFSEKKSRNAEKTEKGDALISSGIVCYGKNLFGSLSWAHKYNLASC